MHAGRGAAEAQAEALELERLAIAGFIDVLLKEQHALVANEIGALETLGAEKLRLIDRLSRHAELRAAWLRDAGQRPDAAGMQAWLASRAAFPGIAAAWARVTGLARVARERNELNGWLVGLQMQRTRRQLEFLDRAACNESTYASDGATRPAVRQRSLGEA